MDKLIIYSIAYACPYNKRTLNCPLKKLDNYPFKARLAQIDRMKEDEIETILGYHTVCKFIRRDS